MSTPTAVLDFSLVGALTQAATMLGTALRLGNHGGGYCIERLNGTRWVVYTEIFKTLAEVQAYALGFAEGFQRGNEK